MRLSNVDGCNDPIEGKTLYEWMSVKEPESEDRYPLILSFCQGTPENLPMGSTYADNSTGVGLELKDESIAKLSSTKDMYAGMTTKYKLMEDDTTFNNNKSVDDKKSPTLYHVLYVIRDSSLSLSKTNNFNDKKIEKIEKLFKKLSNDYKKILRFKDSTDNLKSYLPKLLIELAHLIKYDDYAYEKEVRLVRFGFKEDINNDNAPLEYCENSKRVYREAPEIEFKSVATAPRVKDKDYRYIKYFADANDIVAKKSKIKFR